MKSLLTLDDIAAARAVQDPDLAPLMVALIRAADPKVATREGAQSWRDIRQRHQSKAFRKLDADVRQQQRVADWEAVQATDAELPLPERLKVHAQINELWADDSAWARERLLEIIATTPLVLGPWKALKGIFKAAEAKGDWEVYAALAVRFDCAYADRSVNEISRATLRYLVRRAWRNLRQIGVRLPAVFPDAACDMLRNYPAHSNLRSTWIANHILSHEGGQYSRSGFRRSRWSSDPPLGNRAFTDAWKRTPRPLFSLLETAENEQVRGFAAKALRTDFRTQLREVEADWVVRLIGVDSTSVHDFAVWLLDEVPTFEAGSFRELGLHLPVLGLLDSESNKAASWAATYARTHARDLPLEQLVRMANGEHAEVRKLSRDLLRDRDARKEVGLDAWGRLLGTPHAHKLAATALREHFTARELTLEWFTERFLSGDRKVVDFASDALQKVHAKKSITLAFWQDLLDHVRADARATQVALSALDGLKLEQLDDDVLRRAWLAPYSKRTVRGWISGGRISATRLGAPFLKAMAFHPTYEADAWVTALRASDRPWAHNRDFNTDTSQFALEMLSDARTFSAEDLGFDWLFEMVQRQEPDYQQFAMHTLTKSFKPEDFADQADKTETQTDATPEDADLLQKSFLFTGKLSTMSRGEANKMVKGANGRTASGVNAKLDFLVIGDEGSPLYGGGRKGSKQVKAEKIREAGAPLAIISETAFLQMLAGESVEVDEGAALAGAERLWQMAISPGLSDAPLRAFALHYLLMHHDGIHMEQTDRPLDPGAALTDEFLSFERCAVLCGDERPALRKLGLTWMKWELARWAPEMSAIVPLCELPYAEVREFIEMALTCDDNRSHRRYRLDPDKLTPDAVYRFCESLDPGARGLGMRLIGLHPRLAIPSELFRLTESPDRSVRGFVIRQLWRLYRDKGASDSWTPPKREGEEALAARPEALPASEQDVRVFLRRTLFGLPPGPTVRKPGTLRPLPARTAKLALIEICRDLALEDVAFAEKVKPMFAEFLHSKGLSESAACLVALTRIRAKYPQLDGASS